MWTILSTAWTATGFGKYWQYIVTGLLVIGTVVAIYVEGKKSGTSAASTKQLQDSLNIRVQEAKDRAKIQSLNTDAARIRLRNKWSAN